MMLTRRNMMVSTGAAGLLGAVTLGEETRAKARVETPSHVGEVRDRIGLSDLEFTRPAARSEEGTPVGNGRMGSLVWATPSQLHFQINRVDVYPAGSASNSFYEAHNDYCGGCAFLDIAFEGRPFAGLNYREYLSVHDGILTFEGDSVTVNIVPVRSHDVFAVLIEHAGRPAKVSAVLRMLRFAPSYPDARDGEATVRQKSHTATSRLHALDGAIALSQHFSEADFSAHSAVAVRFADGATSSEVLNETEVHLAGPVTGGALLLIGSAASFSRAGDNVVPVARAQVDVAAAAGYARLAADTRGWWQEYWEQGSLTLRSEDGAAQALQSGYHYFLYLMASCSAGNLPPKFNGMLWNTGGDLRAWGAQHWFTNASCYYEALPASGRFTLMDPLFDMYSDMAESAARAARSVWSSQGLFIPETVHFDGVEALPEPIAAEMRALNLGRKSWGERSDAFKAFAETRHPYSTLWNWKTPGEWREGRYVTGERGQGPYGPTSHIFAATAKIAYLFWQRYEFTRDEEWLRRRAYPMLRGAVEFYRHHPLVALGADGRIHIDRANNSEPVRGARDTNEDLSAMRAVTSALVAAATKLNIEPDQREIWRAFLSKLAPLATTADPGALGYDPDRSPPTWAAGVGPARFALSDRLSPDPNSMPGWFFDLCAVATRDQLLKAQGRATFERLAEEHGPGTPGWNGGLSKLPIAAALVGDRNSVRRLLPAQMDASAPGATPIAEKWASLRNMMNLGEGPQALSAQHLGRASEALHLALLQSNPPAPGEDPVLILFPAWPGDWDADYRLHARGGFIVEAAIRKGTLLRVQLSSSAGAPCRMSNPFGTPVRLIRDGIEAEYLDNDLLDFSTRAGERIALRRA